MASVFPTSSAPTSSTSSPTTTTPGVGNFPSLTISNEFIKLRFFEPDVPKAVNQRWLGMPRGVYLGFVPATTPGSKLLTLNVDAMQHFSLLKVPTKINSVMVDIFTSEALELDFTGHSVWPVYVVASSTYNDRTPTQGKIFTRATPANDVDEVTVCKVDYSGGNLVVSTDFPVNRQPPVAFDTQPYGFMPEAAVENLATTNATVAEVIAARDSSFTGANASLKGRIDADMGGAGMATRLGLRLVNVISNLHLGKTGSSFNVSSSFSETGRELGPTLTISAGGSESVEGALTSGSRNFCFVVDGTSGQRIIDSTTGDPVYGQLAYVTSSIGGGKEIQFVNASVDVSGNGTNPFSLPLQAGDLVQGPDGLYYEVEDILDPDNAVLGAAYRGADASQFNAQFRRWTLFLFTVSGGPFALGSSTNIRFLFPCFFRTDRAIFDGFLFIKQDGERPQLPLATSTVAGKTRLAIDGGLAGSFRTVKSAGLPVGSDIHTLNFAYGGATANPFLPGVADVSVPGETGPQGTPSNVGAPGPTGAAGFGYSINNSFENGPETGFTASPPTPGPRLVSHVVDWTMASPSLVDLSPSRSYAHVNGGWSKINGFGGFEWIRITDIVAVTSNESVINYRIDPMPWTSGTTIRCYMGASQ